MTKILTAVYDEKHLTLKLPERLAGVEDHAMLRIVLEPFPEGEDRTWKHLRGILSKDAGASLARALNDAGFGPIDE